MTTTIKTLEIEAQRIAFDSRGSETKEQAFARLLEANPEVYAAYRAQHNAAPMVHALRQAGVEVKEVR